MSNDWRSKYRNLPCQKTKDGAMPLYDCDGKIYCDGDQSVRKIVNSEGEAYPTDGSGNQVLDVKEDVELKTFITECMSDLGVTGPDGAAQFGMVAADGSITLPEGGTAPAVDGQGNPIPAGEAVLNIFDGDGNYVGSKICPATLNKCVVTGYDLATCTPVTESAAVQASDKVMTNDSFRCNFEDGSITIGDNRFGVTLEHIDTPVPFNSFTADQSIVDGDLLWESPIYEFTTSCAGPVHIHGMWGWSVPVTSGALASFWQYSINGGPWLIDRGGLDGYGTAGSASFNDSGSVDSDFVVSANPNAVKGLNTIQYRIVAHVSATAPNTLQSLIRNNASGWGLTYPRLCCN